MTFAERDGTMCGICGEPVDLSLRRPDQRCASVDHVIPVARGGTDDLDNLQLAHLVCNQRKSDNVGPNDGAQTAVGSRSSRKEASLPWP